MDLLTVAKKIADRVEAESFKQNVPVAVTVIDIHGNVVLTPYRFNNVVNWSDLQVQ